MSFADRFEEVRARMERAAQRTGRRASDITLIGVTKTKPVGDIVSALDAGLLDLGENRAQELVRKARVIGDRARWHFIGNLQTNKVKDVVGVAHLIHAVDRAELGAAIDRRAELSGVIQDVLIEVNVAGEPSKHGVAPRRLAPLAASLGELDHIRLGGLMTVPPWPDDPEESRPHYGRLTELGLQLRDSFPEATELSMGMTRDFEIAIEEGATLIRVGEALFGPRS